LIVAAIPLNKTGALLLLVIVGGVIGASELFLMTPKPHTRKLENHVIMKILDEGIKQESLQIQYDKKPSNTAYLEQTINCIAVEKEQQTLVFMETISLQVEHVTFTDTVGDGTGDELMVVSFVNSGTSYVEFVQVTFNDVTQTGNWELTSDENKIGAGESDIVQITVDWTPGNNYSIEFVATDGTVVSSLFTTTA